MFLIKLLTINFWWHFHVIECLKLSQKISLQLSSNRIFIVDIHFRYFSTSPHPWLKRTAWLWNSFSAGIERKKERKKERNNDCSSKVRKKVVDSFFSFSECPLSCLPTFKGLLFHFKLLKNNFFKLKIRY